MFKSIYKIITIDFVDDFFNFIPKGFNRYSEKKKDHLILLDSIVRFEDFIEGKENYDSIRIKVRDFRITLEDKYC